MNLFGVILIHKKQTASFRKERRMRHKSIDLMKSIQNFIEKYYMQNRHSPSTTEIAEEVGIARGTAYKYLVTMRENGMIQYDGESISTDKTEKIAVEHTTRTCI
jgi:repressor LexA